MATSKHVSIESEHQRINQHRKKYPGLITGGLPVELQLAIIKNLPAKDIAKLSSTCRSANEVIKENAKSIANPIIKNESGRLKKAANHLNFAGLSFVTAMHRFIDHFDIERYQFIFDDALFGDSFRFVEAYSSANPQFGDANNFDNEDAYLDALHRAMGTMVGISDWLQYYSGGTLATVLGNRLEDWGWNGALAAAAGYTREDKPGRYCDLIRLFQEDVVAITDPLVIIQMFEEIRARPLECLPAWTPIFDHPFDEPLGRVAEWYDSSFDSDVDEQSEFKTTDEISELAIQEAREPRVVTNRLDHGLPPVYSDSDFRNDLRKLRGELGLPEIVNGFPLFLWASHGRARLLMEKISRFEEDKAGMLFAALLSELDLYFR